MRNIGKLTNLQLTRNDPNKKQSGRRNRGDLSWKAPLIGGKRIGAGKTILINPLFYTTNRVEIEKYIAAGVLRLDVSPTVRDEWDRLVAEMPDVLPSKSVRLSELAEAQAVLAAEAAERAQYEKDKAEAFAKARKLSAERKKGKAPELTNLSDDLGFLSDIPPAHMTEEQRNALAANVVTQPENEEDVPVATQEDPAPAIPVAVETEAEAKEPHAAEEPEEAKPKVTRKRKSAVTRRRGNPTS